MNIDDHFTIICNNCNSDNVFVMSQHIDSYSGTHVFITCHDCGKRLCVNTGKITEYSYGVKK